MKRYNAIRLIDQLQSDIRQIILRVNQLKSADPGILLEQPAPGKWSIIEIIEHLNSYNRYYNKAIEKSLQAGKPAVVFFKPGWLGDFFTKLMRPSENGKVKNKMKAPKNHRPPRTLDSLPVLNAFLTHQHHLLDLLEQAKAKDIGGIRTPISISPFIRLKVGDVFRFLIAHQQRHFIQLENALLAVRGIRRDKYPAALPVM
jgi:hypothetical protein